MVLLCSAITSSAQRLIVRMDDIGATHSENIAVIKCYQEGIGTVAEICLFVLGFSKEPVCAMRIPAWM